MNTTLRRSLVTLVFSLASAALAAGPTMPAESLLIGPGDLLHISIVDTPEMDQHARVTDRGEVPLVAVGNLKVAGLTPAEAATAVHDRLIKAHYLNHPEVAVAVEQYATQNVSVLGQVRSSGTYPLGTARSVLDVLALAGGLDGTADRNILIERHGDPQHPVHYNLSNNPEEAVGNQVIVYPGDTVIVPRAGIVYILGDVNRPGGFVMGNNDSKMTLLQALALAGGVTKSAKQGHARLIRKQTGAIKEVQLSLGEIQKGKLPDMAMMPGDVLYVPFSYVKNIATNSAGIAASATSAAIYAIP
jgi:polysaccharide export outer membrane protein